MDELIKALTDGYGIHDVFDALATAYEAKAKALGDEAGKLCRAAACFSYEVVTRTKEGIAEDKGLTIGEEVVERFALSPTADLDVVVDSVICDQVIRTKRKEFEKPKEYFPIIIKAINKDGEVVEVDEGNQQIEGIPGRVRRLKEIKGVVRVFADVALPY